MTNSDIREWYLRKVATIPDLDLEWTKNGDLLEARARRAWEIRHNARREARSMMENKAEVEVLRRRDLTIYGDPDGPTFAQLIAAGSDAGLSTDEILSGSSPGRKRPMRSSTEDYSRRGARNDPIRLK